MLYEMQKEVRRVKLSVSQQITTFRLENMKELRERRQVTTTRDEERIERKSVDPVCVRTNRMERTQYKRNNTKASFVIIAFHSHMCDSLACDCLPDEQFRKYPTEQRLKCMLDSEVCAKERMSHRKSNNVFTWNFSLCSSLFFSAGLHCHMHNKQTNKQINKLTDCDHRKRCTDKANKREKSSKSHKSEHHYY